MIKSIMEEWLATKTAPGSPGRCVGIEPWNLMTPDHDMTKTEQKNWMRLCVCV